jgi:hypothetical protein
MPNVFFIRKFTKDDAFVGYHDDTIPSVVLQVCGKLKQDGTSVSAEMKDEWEDEVSVLHLNRQLLQ